MLLFYHEHHYITSTHQTFISLPTSLIFAGVPNKDAHGKYIECHIFVPFGGVGFPRRDDRVIINLSPDGRVQEAPIIT